MLQKTSKQVPRFQESVPLLWLLFSWSKRTHCSTNQALSLGIALAAFSLFPIEAHAQRENTSRAGGNGGTSYSLECPQNMILIGLRGRAGNFIDQIRGVCSKYDAAGQRIGSTALTSPSSAGGTGGGEWEMMCGGQTALTSIGGRAGVVVDQLFRACKTVAPSGLATAPAFADGIKVGGSNSSAPVFNLSCPNGKFADRIVGRAGNLVDQIGLSCIPAPLAATKIKQLTLGTPANHLSTGEPVTTAVSGASITGTVTLNGYAASAVTVQLSLTPVQGVTVPSTVTVPANSQSAQFTLTSTNTSVGCPCVLATALNTNDRAFAVLTPPPPENAGYTFSLVNPPVGLRYFLGTPVAGRICFSLSCLTLAGRNGSATFASSAPNTLSVPESVPFKATDVNRSVNMVAGSTPGCAIVTSTLDGVSIRRVVIVDQLDH